MNEDTTLACIEVVELVTAYLEGELDPSAAQEIDRHLATCPPCRIYFQQIRQTIADLSDVPVENLSEVRQRELLHAFQQFHPHPS